MRFWRGASQRNNFEQIRALKCEGCIVSVVIAEKISLMLCINRYRVT